MYVGEALVCWEKHNIRMQILGSGVWDTIGKTAMGLQVQISGVFWGLVGFVYMQ